MAAPTPHKVKEEPEDDPMEEGATASGTQRPAEDQEGEFFDFGDDAFKEAFGEALAHSAQVGVPDHDSLAGEQTPCSRHPCLTEQDADQGEKRDGA